MIDAVWRHNALPLAWFKIKGIPGIILFLCYFSQKHQDLLVISCLQKYFKGKRRDSNEQQGFSVAIVVQHPQESLTCQWA